MNNILNLWPASPIASLLVWTVVVMVVLYMGRKQAHQVLYGCGRGLYSCMRVWSFSILLLERQIVGRNKALVLAKPMASSVLAQCLISGLFLVIAALVAYVNFKLIASPLSGLVENIGEAAVLNMSDLLALVFILVEVITGLLLTESLALTRLFPQTSALSGRLRKGMSVCSALILVVLASVQASMFSSHYMCVLGFILPLVLAFTPIPLELFVHSLRVVFGGVFIAILRILYISIRILGRVMNRVFMILRHMYDLVIVVPLGLERLIKAYMGREVQIDVPMLTRVEAEALKSKYRKNSDQSITSKASYKTTPAQVELRQKGAKTVIEDSSIAHVNLTETMVISSL